MFFAGSNHFVPYREKHRSPWCDDFCKELLMNMNLRQLSLCFAQDAMLPAVFQVVSQFENKNFGSTV
jgi:hypothetical protein